MAFLSPASATLPFPGDCPVGFFTNVAARLLASELNVDFTKIQIYPTNRYTPAVHRLLQVTANSYDATTTNFYPSVFRPTFWVTNKNGSRQVYINGYQPVALGPMGTGDPQLSLPLDACQLPFGPSTDHYSDGVNVYGIPWIIGAKKGFPNFNEFSFESLTQVARSLELTRPSVDAPIGAYQTNQMYMLSISNSLGVECWNSYNSNYTSAQLQIYVQDSLFMALTNQEPGGVAMSPIFTNAIMSALVSLSTWPGSAPWMVTRRNGPALPGTNSFLLPLWTNMVLLTNSVYTYRDHLFLPATDGYATNFVDKGIMPMPQFGLLMTNRLQVAMVDEDSLGNYHVIDYVQFAGPAGSWDLNSALADDDPDLPYAGLWNTNQNGSGSAFPYVTPWGVINQIYYSLDPQQRLGSYLIPGDAGTWASPPGGGTVGQEVASFNAFLSPNHWALGTDPATGIFYSTSNLNLSVHVPFTASRIVYQYISWQANDPLIHYLVSDLNFNSTELGGLQTGTHQWNSSSGFPANNLMQANDRFQPWGYTLAGTDTNGYNLACKDPQIRESDNWNFPTNEPGAGIHLGQIHRGTPWQTIYLKASDILNEDQMIGSVTNYVGTNIWMNWTGDFDPADAAAMAPVRDRHFIGYLAALLNTNDLPSLVSLNNPDPNVWLGLLDGMTVLTNTMSELMAQHGILPLRFDTLIVSSNSDQAAAIVSAIQSAQAIQPGRFFSDIGSLLSIPRLTEQSPFLHWNSSAQQSGGISDEAYEEIPNQLLPLLRADSVGSIVPGDGQATVRFTGYDGHAYTVQVSTNLIDWITLSTNSPLNGMLVFTNQTVSPQARFYRSVLGD